jgi:hypothetical protein
MTRRTISVVEAAVALSLCSCGFQGYEPVDVQTAIARLQWLGCSRDRLLSQMAKRRRDRLLRAQRVVDVEGDDLGDAPVGHQVLSHFADCFGNER